ncbi:hypothetical protein AMAG_04242 [Allomyces macrogynus ATCC 38327]|uniref:Uncharacterized protein n=1 Tax=Allomyces macrogynus (strain ATCC 38327) TaxID=578462 RepID=A0A0L0S866_ALLM3|nr:hypothetical protein AMAG_04242 [Allomyces macrogynus ATCC 38327]|eukprot:KNE58687.1 hypothetical protein AMAG_04242 [Allomyces macrogynus ATCC 38327]
MGLYGHENLFVGREPVTPEDHIKSFNLMRGASIATPLPAPLLSRATRFQVAMLLSRDGERPLKQRLYTTLLFRDRHSCSTPTPRERSEKFVFMVNQVVGGLATTGSISSSFLERTKNRHFDLPRTSVLSDEQVVAGRDRGARNGTRDIGMEMVVQWVYVTTTEEAGAREVRRVDLHLQCFALLKMVKDHCYTEFPVRFDEYHHCKHLHDLEVIVSMVLEDWWFGDAQRHGPYAESLDSIRDATELL